MAKQNAVTRRSFLGIGLLGVAAALSGCGSVNSHTETSTTTESVADDTVDEGSQIQESDTEQPADYDDEPDAKQDAYVGSFDYVDRDGYSYHIDCSLNPSISTDSADGKPGYVGLYMDFTDCSVTLTNTTSGKRAPGITFLIYPLYTSDMREMTGSDNASTFTGSDGIEYVDPFTNAPTPDTYERMRIYAGEPYSNYGTTGISDGDELQPNESRELPVRVGHLFTDVETSARMPDILEECADTVKKPLCWALTTCKSNNSLNETVGFIMPATS